MGELNRIEQARLAYQKSHGFHEKHEEGFLRANVEAVVREIYNPMATKDIMKEPDTLGALMARKLRL